MNEKVRFKGAEYWLMSEGLDGQALAPLDHCHADGKLNVSTCFDSPSFAHLYSDGNIIRFGKIIGTKKDLVPVSGVAK